MEIRKRQNTENKNSDSSSGGEKAPLVRLAVYYTTIVSIQIIGNTKQSGEKTWYSYKINVRIYYARQMATKQNKWVEKKEKTKRIAKDCV